MRGAGISSLGAQFPIRFLHTHRAMHLLLDQKTPFLTAEHQKHPSHPLCGFHICFHDQAWSDHEEDLNMGARLKGQHPQTAAMPLPLSLQQTRATQLPNLFTRHARLVYGMATDAGHCTGHVWSNAKGSKPVVDWYKSRFTQLYPIYAAASQAVGKLAAPLAANG